MSNNKMFTRIMLSQNQKTYEVWYSTNGHTYCLHKKGFKSLDAAVKETTKIQGSFRLLNDCMNA
jgi:hypothetical protein